MAQQEKTSDEQQVLAQQHLSGSLEKERECEVKHKTSSTYTSLKLRSRSATVFSASQLSSAIFAR